MTPRAPRATLLRVTSVALLLGAASCAAAPAPRAEWIDPFPAAIPDSVAAVVFLIGDAGDALPGRSPVTTKLASEVERWSAALARDSAVAVFFLGDNVYPEGVRDREDPEFAQDSLKLLNQVLTVAGEHARRFATSGYFLAGNHDWGGRPGPRGTLRLRNQARLFEAFRAEGHHVDLIPDPGAPGPVVVDLGAEARFVAIDTHWWLQDQEEGSKDRVLLELAESLRTAGGRSVTIAAHHPFVSGGSHGGAGTLWDGFGVLWLLRKAGAIAQDLNSTPYRELRVSLGRVFRDEGEPLLFVGGHDHSLQVIAGDEPGEPRWTLVSGAGSRTSRVGPAEGMVWAAGRPGFMRLTYMRSGAVHLHVLMTDDGFSTCDADGDALAACMEEGAARFEVGYATSLLAPEAAPPHGAAVRGLAPTEPGPS